MGRIPPSLLLFLLILILIVILILLSGYRQDATALQLEKLRGELYGFRHGVGAHDALRIVEQKLEEGYVVDADLKGYFDTIPNAGIISDEVCGSFVNLGNFSERRAVVKDRRFVPQRIQKAHRNSHEIQGRVHNIMVSLGLPDGASCPM